jgi:hypothetical protein
MGKRKRQSLRDLARDLVQEAEAKYPEAVAAKRAANGQEGELTDYERGVYNHGPEGKVTVVKDGEVVHGRYELTQAQKTMRAEMLRPRQDFISGQKEVGEIMDDQFLSDHHDGFARKLGEVFDAELGKLGIPDESEQRLFQQQVRDMAYIVINEVTDVTSVRLGLAEWGVVQQMIEEGILRGWQRGRDSR